jgi:hypothetical protein
MALIFSAATRGKRSSTRTYAGTIAHEIPTNPSEFATARSRGACRASQQRLRHTTTHRILERINQRCGRQQARDPRLASQAIR